LVIVRCSLIPQRTFRIRQIRQLESQSHQHLARWTPR
jgi:hypothetical protein